MAKASIRRAIDAGRLYDVGSAIYSTVPPALITIEAWHAAAILAGGNGACLCGESAAWWLGLIDAVPTTIHVAVRGPRAARAGVAWHEFCVPDGERMLHREMPVTIPERIPLDAAPQMTDWQLRRLLAELEFHFDVGPERVVLRRGRPGSARLRCAIAAHIPQLAETRSELERTFVRFLDVRDFEMTEFNHPVGRSTVDAIFRRAGVVVELDGVRGHRGERRILRDHRRDVHRRADGLSVLRYHFTQLITPADQDLIEAELERLGVRRRG